MAAVDHAVGFLRQGLDEAFPSRPRLLALTGDHGEGLGEHDEATHGFFIYESTTVVPLLFHGKSSQGKTWCRPAKAWPPPGLVGPRPDPAGGARLPPLPESDGVNLGPLFKGGRLDIPPALIETRMPFYGYGWSPLTAWRTVDSKWIEAPTARALRPAPRPGRAARSVGGRRTRRPACAASWPPSCAKALAEAGASDDPEVAAALRSLGYAGSAGAAAAEPGEGLADPKDKIRQKNLLDLAETSLDAGETLEALALFDVVLAGEPANRYALLRSGQTLARIGQFPEAIATLEKLLAIDPGQNEARFDLADALGRSGKIPEATQQWMELLERQPGRAIAWSNLGTLLLRQGDLVKAEEALTKAYALESHNPVVRANLGDCRYIAAVAA